MPLQLPLMMIHAGAEEAGSLVFDIASLAIPLKGGLVRSGLTLLGRMFTGGMERFGFFRKDVINTGGRQLTSACSSLRAEEEAAQFYEKIRANSSNADVIAISKNTGIADYRIQRIKEHIFINKHILSKGRIAQFDPYIEISNAWIRLQNGNFVKQDIQLLQHEYFESRFESIFRTDYTTAHSVAVRSGRTWDPDEFIAPVSNVNKRL